MSTNKTFRGAAACRWGSVLVLVLLALPAALPAQTQSPGPDCCAFLYSTGRWLGWAASFLEYTALREAPADADRILLQSLRFAGENVALANSSCSPELPAWPAWRQQQLWLEGQIAELQKPSDPVKSHAYRRQLAASAIAGTYEIWGRELSRQRLDGDLLQQPTCATYYFKLGFDLAYTTQAFRQADEAYLAGNMQAALHQLNQTRIRLSKALAVLESYGAIQSSESLTVDCADIGLDGLKQLIQFVASRPPSFDNYREELRVVSDTSNNIGNLLQANCIPGQEQREELETPPEPAPGPIGDGVPVNVADATHFTGSFVVTDPTRTYSQYYCQAILFENGTGRGKEWSNNVPMNVKYTQSMDRNGYVPFLWSFDSATGKFTFDWTCAGQYPGLGYFEGFVTGDTNDFTLSGRWSNGTSGQNRFSRER